MPLTPLQNDLLEVLARNRSEESHFAGGVILHLGDDSARFSNDFDIFHELAEAVTAASNRDVISLRAAGYQVETPSRHGEWEKDSTFRKARIVRGDESAEIDWAADSAFRFFPIERDPQLGWRLHRFDISNNNSSTTGPFCLVVEWLGLKTWYSSRHQQIDL